VWQPYRPSSSTTPEQYFRQDGAGAGSGDLNRRHEERALTRITIALSVATIISVVQNGKKYLFHGQCKVRRMRPAKA